MITFIIRLEDMRFPNFASEQFFTSHLVTLNEPNKSAAMIFIKELLLCFFSAKLFVFAFAHSSEILVLVCHLHTEAPLRFLLKNMISCPSLS